MLKISSALQIMRNVEYKKKMKHYIISFQCLNHPEMINDF